MAEAESENGLFFVKPAELAFGRVVITPDGPHPYKVVFRLGEHVLSEHPVPTVREGEALIRREIAHIQFHAHVERPDPGAPKRPDPEAKRDHLSAVE